MVLQVSSLNPGAPLNQLNLKLLSTLVSSFENEGGNDNIPIL